MKDASSSLKSTAITHFGKQTTIDQNLLGTLGGFVRATYTVFYVRAPIHAQVAERLKDTPQPVHSSPEKELEAIKKILDGKDFVFNHRQLQQKELLGTMGILMQFTDVLPKLRPYFQTNFADVDRLYAQVIHDANKAPLSFAQQLSIALDQTNNDLIEAVWRLFVTSRLYARWYDIEAITALPKFSNNQVVSKMQKWSQSLKAVKPYQPDAYQDVAGDVYYCWTHVLAKIVFSYLAARQTPLTKLEALALTHGTMLNHKLAHKVRPQSTPNDHTVSAVYGNAIGDACINTLLE